MYLNVDLGEEIKPNLEIEKAVMPYIDACNIACGGHAGNEDTMRASVLLAKQYQVKLGAHPSYPDRKNFGRITMPIDENKIRVSILHQIQKLQKIALKENIQIHHIKLHGALYNDAARDRNIANIIVETVKYFDPHCILLVPPKSELSKIASEQNLKIHFEVFGDRNYNDDLSLMSRSFKKALILNQHDLSIHIKSMLENQKIVSAFGTSLQVNMDTICMHSDHDKAVDNIKLAAEWIKKHQA